MLTLELQTTILLDDPSSDDGFVTWLEADVIDDHPHAEHATKVGHAQVAVVHVGMIVDAGRSVHDVLDADSGELAVLYETYFEDGWLRGDLTAGGRGSDLLYVSELDVETSYVGRNVDVAVVRRLCDTLGAGCGLAVMPRVAHDDVERWLAAGFKVTRPVRHVDPGYLHWNTSIKPPIETGRPRWPARHEARDRR
jgi:hypothetical protein